MRGKKIMPNPYEYCMTFKKSCLRQLLRRTSGGDASVILTYSFMIVNQHPRRQRVHTSLLVKGLPACTPTLIETPRVSNVLHRKQF